MKKPINKNPSRLAIIIVLALFMSVILSACGNQTPVATPTARDPSLPVSYSKDIVPILQASCVKCHGVEKVSRGLDLTAYDKLMNGSIKGPVVVPNNADKSTLFTLAQQGKMPKQGQPLTAAQLDLIKGWIDAGALNN